MNKLIFRFYLLTLSISAVRSLEESSILKSQNVVSTIKEGSSRQSSGELDETLSMLLNKDDILNISDLNKIYNSLENFFARTKYLKEPTENENIEKIDTQDEIRSASKIKSAENSDSKPEEIIGAPAKLDVENNGQSGKSKIGNNGRSMSAEITSDRNGYKGSTESSGIDVKSADFLQNDENDNKDLTKVTIDEKSGKNIKTVVPNDESNTAWDILDDIPITRRMLSQSSKGSLDEKAAQEHSKPVESIKITPKSDFKSLSGRNQNDARTKAPTIFIPHVYRGLPRRRFQIVPGLIVSSAIPVEFRKLLNQDKVNGENYQIIEKSEMFPESKGAEDTNSEHSNAYPYAPVPEIPHVQQLSSANTVFSKLAQASEHPYRVSSNLSGQNLNNYREILYNLKPNYIPLPVIDMYRYVSGYRPLA